MDPATTNHSPSKQSESPGSAAMFPPLALGAEVPNFSATTQNGAFDFYSSYNDCWTIILSHPADFTPVCLTELSMVQKLLPEFKKRNTNILGLSVDSVASHKAFLNDIADTQGIDITFPIVADEDGSLARQLGMIHPLASGTGAGKMTVRTLLIVDPEKRLQLQMHYPTSTGRNFAEVLRCLDSLQLAAEHPVGTPANWQIGEDVVILPSVDDAQATSHFDKGFMAIKPYFRLTPHPDKSS